jgi:hypothetical protein
MRRLRPSWPTWGALLPHQFHRRQRPHRHRAETLIVSSGMVADDPGMGELHDSRLNDTLA